MKIWLVNHYAKTPGQSGGTRHFVMGRELARRGHEVTIFASSVDHATCRESHLLPHERWKAEWVEGVRFVWLRTPLYSKNDWRRMRNMIAFARAIRRQQAAAGLASPDIVMGSSPHLYAADAARLVARRLSAPFVMEMRDPWPQILVDLGRMSRRHPVIWSMERIEKRLYSDAEHIVTVWPLMVEHIVEKGGRRERVTWIPNGIDLATLPSPAPPAPRGRVVFMYAGKHGLANGLDLILDAAKTLQDGSEPTRAEFHFVGSGPEKARLEARAREERIHNVRFRAEVPKSEVFRVLTEADAFLMTLRKAPVFRYGNSPNKLFEYMAAARPIVFSIGSTYNPVAEAGAGLTVEPDDRDSMVAAIRRLCALSRDQRWQMGLDGRRFVERHHDLRMLAHRLEAVLQQQLALPAAESRPARDQRE